MTFPLMALAVGALVAGFVGIPAALGGTNAIEHFLEPSFTASAHVEPAQRRRRTPSRPKRAAGHEAPHASPRVELGLMGFSVLIARRRHPARAEVLRDQPGDRPSSMAERFAGAHRTLSHKYYVDELYDATAIAGTFAAARSLWTFDRKVVDGAVNGTSWITVISSWFSGLTDRTVVDGVVNLVGWVVQESSLVFRRFQTGLVQNYALLMLFGIFAFVGVYLFVRS